MFRGLFNAVQPGSSPVSQRGGVAMPEPVRCDICGKLYSSRHVSSHKRLAHAKHSVGSTSGEKQIKNILELYKTLSTEQKKRVLAELVAGEQQSS
jgi:hypothetical protein